MVITTGTFLRGVLHVGSKIIPAGRMPTCVTASPDETAAKASGRAADRMYGLGFRVGRLKTGTPPRLDGATIEWDGPRYNRETNRRDRSGSSRRVVRVRWTTGRGGRPGVVAAAAQVSCYATRTTAETEALREIVVVVVGVVVASSGRVGVCPSRASVLSVSRRSFVGFPTARTSSGSSPRA